MNWIKNAIFYKTKSKALNLPAIVRHENSSFHIIFNYQKLQLTRAKFCHIIVPNRCDSYE